MDGKCGWAVFSLVFFPWTAARATPSACGVDTLTNYATAGFSCTIGDKTFNSVVFVLSSVAGGGSATPTSADLITVSPGGDSSNATFSFQASYLASGLLAPETLTLGYTGVAPLSDPFTSAGLSLAGASVTGAAAITAAEALCENGSFTTITVPLVCSSGVALNTTLTSSISNANLGAQITVNFSPLTTLGVVKQITLTGALDSSASASGLNNVLTATSPEPSSLLVGCGLWLIRGKRRCG